jgi:hypothetical protein
MVEARLAGRHAVNSLADFVTGTKTTFTTDNLGVVRRTNRPKVRERFHVLQRIGLRDSSRAIAIGVFGV